MRLAFEVITDPVAKARPRVAIRGGHAHAYTPRKTEEAEWRIRTAFRSEFPTHVAWLGPLELRVVAFIAMPLSIPKSRRATARPVTRPDCDNYLKTVLDALNGVAFRDDSQVVSVMCSKRYAREAPPSWAIDLTQVDWS